ncbi:MAG: IS21 family transposase [Dehalococcoidia bacterium]|nr:IS21 family transposase [Dehalococcoidia bacterium]
MAFKEVSLVELIEVIGRWQTGLGQWAVARTTGLSRGTVRKYLQAAIAAGVRQDGPAPTDQQLLVLAPLNRSGPKHPGVPSTDRLAPWHDRIEQWVRRERLQLTRVYELLGGPERSPVSYTSLRRYVRRQGWTTPAATVRLPDPPPGQVAECDFGRLGYLTDPETGQKRLLWALLVVLAYSRHCFVWPLYQQTLEEVIAGFEAAWFFFKGIPRTLVIDNFPAAVAGPHPLDPQLTRAFLEYSQRRGFLADPARPYHPKDKPKVERGVPYVRERFYKGGTFHDLADVRTQAQHWCVEVAGQRIHGTTRRLPLVVFQEEEQAQLLPYDGEPYAMPDWRAATVHPDHHVAYRYALYSVPAASCPPGTKVELIGDAGLVRIYHRGVVVKVHPRQAQGGRSTDDADYPQELTMYTTRSPERAKRQALLLGVAVGAFIERLLAGTYPWSRLRQAQKLLRLGERYTPVRLDAACQRALEVDLLDVRRVERILVQALEADQATTPPVNTTDGQPLLFLLPARFARPGAVFAHTGQPHPVPAAAATEPQRRLL